MGGFDGDGFSGVATRARLGSLAEKAIVVRWSPRPETDALWGIEVSLLTSAATRSGFIAGRFCEWVGRGRFPALVEAKGDWQFWVSDSALPPFEY